MATYTVHEGTPFVGRAKRWLVIAPWGIVGRYRTRKGARIACTRRNKGVQL